jgi:hypothetical protein
MCKAPPVTESPEQSCAKAPVEKRDECMLIAKKIWAFRLKGAAAKPSAKTLSHGKR